jgi:hypothetical protein
VLNRYRNNYLCNKLRHLIFFRIKHVIFLSRHFSDTEHGTRFTDFEKVAVFSGSVEEVVLRKLLRLSNVDQGKWQTTICLPIKRSGRLPNPRHVGNGCGGLQFMCGGREAHRLSRYPPTRGCQFDRISTKSGRLRPVFSG